MKPRRSLTFTKKPNLLLYKSPIQLFDCMCADSPIDVILSNSRRNIFVKKFRVVHCQHAQEIEECSRHPGLIEMFASKPIHSTDKVLRDLCYTSAGLESSRFDANSNWLLMVNNWVSRSVNFDPVSTIHGCFWRTLPHIGHPRTCNYFCDVTDTPVCPSVVLFIKFSLQKRGHTGLTVASLVSRVFPSKSVK